MDDTSRNITEIPKDWRQLPIPMPPMLPEVIGLDSSARYFSLHYEGAKAFWSDGRAGSTFPYYAAYEPYIRHFTMALHLLDVHLGSDDRPATHALLVDREERAVYVGDYGQVRRWLDHQHPPRRPPTEAEIEEMNREIERMQRMGVDEMRERGMFEFMLGATEQKQERCREMVAWLDEFIDEDLVLSYLKAAQEGNMTALYHLNRFQQRLEASDSINPSSGLVH